MSDAKQVNYCIVRKGDNKNTREINLCFYMSKGYSENKRNFTGRILIEFSNGVPGDIIPLRKNEFITSVKEFERALQLTGMRLSGN